MGAEDLLRGGSLDTVVDIAGGVTGGVGSSRVFLISPVQPTNVWFHGMLSEDKKAKESKSAEVPRRGLSSYTSLMEILAFTMRETNPITTFSVLQGVRYTESCGNHGATQ